MSSRSHQPRLSPEITWIKKLGWVYFLLLIFEGALRKWVLPGLATPLLIVREPVAIGIIALSLQSGAFPQNRWVIGFVVLGILGSLFAMTTGHGNLAVTAYGARIFLLHLPVLFILGRVLSREDVLQFGRAMLWLSLPMTLLIALQFYSPQSAFVNTGIGGEGSAGFSGALGRSRPPGTFSFTNGTTLFYSLLGPFLFFAWLRKSFVPIWLKYAATFALLLAIPLSISRGLLFQTVLTTLFGVLTLARTPQLFGRFLAAGIGLVVLILILGQFSFFQGATEVLSARFEKASRSEGGLEGTLVDRFLGGLVGAVANSTEEPFLGRGMGMGTNVGAMLLSGELTFLVAEGEWGRVIGEMGTLLGLIVVALRLDFAAQLLLRAWNLLAQGRLLPWLLMGFGLLNIAQGGWAQPTALGFFVMAGALTMASMRGPVSSASSFRRRDTPVPQQNIDPRSCRRETVNEENVPFK